MLEKLKKSLKDFWANPYVAPLTQAVGGVLHCAHKPIRHFTEGVARAFDDETYKWDREWLESSKMSRFFHEANKYDSGFGFIAVAGAVVGGLAFAGGGALAGAAIMGGLAGKITAAVVLGLACSGVGAVAGPFIMAGVVATVGGIVGLGIGLVPGFFKGCGTAVNHFKERKIRAEIQKSLPPRQAQDEALAENLAKVMQEFNKLPKEHRAAFVRMMNECYDKEASGNQFSKAQAALDAMPEDHRENFIRSLKERMKDEFAAVADKDAASSVVLQTPVAASGTIKLKQGA
jgi:hypothetical protein